MASPQKARTHSVSGDGEDMPGDEGDDGDEARLVEKSDEHVKSKKPAAPAAVGGGEHGDDVGG